MGVYLHSTARTLRKTQMLHYSAQDSCYEPCIAVIESWKQT